jgi:hypothetical protein
MLHAGRCPLCRRRTMIKGGWRVKQTKHRNCCLVYVSGRVMKPIHASCILRPAPAGSLGFRLASISVCVLRIEPRLPRAGAHSRGRTMPALPRSAKATGGGGVARRLERAERDKEEGGAARAPPSPCLVDVAPERRPFGESSGTAVAKIREADASGFRTNGPEYGCHGQPL